MPTGEQDKQKGRRVRIVISAVHTGRCLDRFVDLVPYRRFSCLLSEVPVVTVRNGLKVESVAGHGRPLRPIYPSHARYFIYYSFHSFLINKEFIY